MSKHMAVLTDWQGSPALTAGVIEFNFDLTRNVDEGYKIGYFEVTDRPSQFKQGGCIFFYAGDNKRILGVYGQAEIGEFGLDHQPANPSYKTIQIRTPQSMVCRFETPLEADLVRHAGGKYFGPNGFYYIDDTVAGNILDDAIKQHPQGSPGREKLETIRACLDLDSSGRSIWKIAPGEGAQYWVECRDNGIISLGWQGIGDYRTYVTREALQQALEEKTTNKDTTSIWHFVHGVSEGDIVVANAGRTKVVGIGLVQGDYTYGNNTRNPNPKHPNYRLVKWKITEPVELQFQFGQPTVLPVKANQWQQIKQAYLQQNPALQPIFDEIEGPITMPELVPTLKDIFLKTKNVILYGPPGTGKTYVARTFAKHLTGNRVSQAAKTPPRFWCIVANPAEWHWDRMFETGIVGYREGKLKRNYATIRPGDLVFGYLSSPDRQIYCLAEVVPKPAKPATDRPLYLKGVRKLTQPVALKQLRDDPILTIAEPLQHNMQGTLFRLEPHEAKRLGELIEADNPEVADTLEPYWGATPAEYVRTVTFHQSYGYEDFIEGLRPVPNQQGQIIFEWRPGIFKQMCQDAAADPDNDFILIIDEINRGNIAKIFGELITLLEDDKRANQDTEITVTLPGSQQRFSVPDNLYVLGTMNTADRSIALLDVALRRRFTFVEVAPDATQVPEQPVEGVPLRALFTRFNRRIEALLDRDHCLGHSYFMNIKSLDHLHYVWYRKIIPLLEEYFYNDGERLRAALDNFVVRQKITTDVFAHPPETFDLDLHGYRIESWAGEKFVEELKRIAGVG